MRQEKLNLLSPVSIFVPRGFSDKSIFTRLEGSLDLKDICQVTLSN